MTVSCFNVLNVNRCIGLKMCCSFHSDKTSVMVSSCSPLETVKYIGINLFQEQKMLRLL